MKILHAMPGSGASPAKRKGITSNRPRNMRSGANRPRNSRLGDTNEFHIDREIRDWAQINREIRDWKVLVNITLTAKFAIWSKSTAKFAGGSLLQKWTCAGRLSARNEKEKHQQLQELEPFMVF